MFKYNDIICVNIWARELKCSFGAAVWSYFQYLNAIYFLLLALFLTLDNS